MNQNMLRRVELQVSVAHQTLVVRNGRVITPDGHDVGSYLSGEGKAGFQRYAWTPETTNKCRKKVIGKVNLDTTDGSQCSHQKHEACLYTRTTWHY